MKAIIPYAVLGIIGASGAFVGVRHHAGSVPPTPTPTASPTDAPVKVSTSLDRTALPANGGDAFVRVALEGVPPKEEKHDRIPVSLTLVIDRSGSMGTGNKMDDAKRAAIEAIASLQPGDKVCAVSFDDGADNLGCADVGNGNEQLKSRINALFARSGTDMASGLRVGGDAATSIFQQSRVNRMMLLSDGRPDSESGLKDQVAALARSGVTTTTLGLGQDYNEDLMSGLADSGLGHYYFVEKPEQLVSIFSDELKSLATVVARQAVVELEPKNGAEIKDVIGFRFDRSGNKVVIPAGDIYGGRVTDILVRMTTQALTGQNDVVVAHVAYVDAKSAAPLAEDRTLAALFTSDANAVTASVVPDVAVKSEKWRAAQALLDANAAYDRGEKDIGDKILGASAARLNDQAVAFKNDDLKAEAAEQQKFQVQNEAGGEGWRGVGTKAAKKRAWSMNKGSAY